MAESTSYQTLTTTEWKKIELDPDSDGYTKMYIFEDKDTPAGEYTRFSTINTVTKAPNIPNDYILVDFDIYVKNNSASELTPVYVHVVRV